MKSGESSSDRQESMANIKLNKKKGGRRTQGGKKYQAVARPRTGRLKMGGAAGRKGKTVQVDVKNRKQGW